MKCAFEDCKDTPCGAKQFNDIFVRAYLCRGHLIAISHLNSERDGDKFINLLRGLEE